jgi:manganese/zinc/iron transport system permease protein
VLAGTMLLGATAGLVGTLAVLHRRSLMGDVLAHAALPGICLAFMATGERRVPMLLLGAFGSGLLGTAVVSWLQRFVRVRSDAAIGIVLSVFFGAGVVLLQVIQTQWPGGSKAGLASYILGRIASTSSEDVGWIAALSLAAVSIVGLFYKEFRLVIFDREFASSQGWPAEGLDQGLMALVALTVVVSLPAAGVVLTASLLILPAATARFWTERFDRLLWLSSLLGAGIGASGTLLSAHSSLPAGPVIVLAGSAAFVSSWLLAPGRGLAVQAWRRAGERMRMEEQWALLRLCRAPTGGFPLPPRLGRRLVASGWAAAEGAGLRPTDAGRERAARLQNRLTEWERLWEISPEAAREAATLDIERMGGLFDNGKIRP